MKYLLIINAIIWAAIILLASWLFKGAENYETLFAILMVAAGLQNAIIYNFLKRGRKIKNFQKK